MRYSKAKMIMAGIITFVCLIAVGFGIYKGIDYSKKLTEGTDTKKDTSKALATVYKNKDTKKKTTTKKKANTKKKTTKKTETKTTKKKTEEKKTTTKKETKKEEEKVVKKEVETDFDNNKVGFYKVVELTVKNKSYSKEDIEKLRNAGYSLSLQVNSNGIATVSVLSISKSYEFTDEYFDDGFNQYPYTYKKNKLSITIDDYDIVFEKE